MLKSYTDYNEKCNIRLIKIITNCFKHVSQNRKQYNEMKKKKAIYNTNIIEWNVIVYFLLKRSSASSRTSKKKSII